jgi:hypothetical protein
MDTKILVLKGGKPGTIGLHERVITGKDGVSRTQRVTPTRRRTMTASFHSWMRSMQAPNPDRARELLKDWPGMTLFPVYNRGSCARVLDGEVPPYSVAGYCKDSSEQAETSSPDKK